MSKSLLRKPTRVRNRHKGPDQWCPAWIEGGGDRLMDTGRINGWECKHCGWITYAVHVDDGVTPMFLGCRNPAGCTSRDPAVSLMYPDAEPPPHIIGSVAWEWYKPTEKQTRRLERKHPGMADHVQQGGLDLRPLTDAGRAVLTPTGEPSDD